MSLHPPGDSGDPGHPKTKLGRVDGSQASAERRLVRDGTQIVGHGALFCPQCALPFAVPGRLPAGLELPARDFLAGNVYDTVGNEVYLVARVA